MYVYMYIYMYIYIHICVYNIYMHIYVYLHIFIFVYVYEMQHLTQHVIAHRTLHFTLLHTHQHLHFSTHTATLTLPHSNFKTETARQRRQEAQSPVGLWSGYMFHIEQSSYCSALRCAAVRETVGLWSDKTWQSTSFITCSRDILQHIHSQTLQDACLQDAHTERGTRHTRQHCTRHTRQHRTGHRRQHRYQETLAEMGTRHTHGTPQTRHTQGTGETGQYRY